MNPQRPRDWSTARETKSRSVVPDPRTTAETPVPDESVAGSPVAAEESSTYAVRRYAIHAEIGAGRVATVHLGRLLGPDEFARTVAVKRIRSQYTNDAELLAILLDGARLAARVRHPNVVPTLDVVTGGKLLIVMEYVHGESLATLLRTLRGRGTAAPLPVVSGIFAPVLRGLHAIHRARGEAGSLERAERSAERNVPHDILVGTDGVPRLIDLGVGPTSHRGTDLFAASVMLWEALAGRSPLPRMAPEGFEPPSRYRPEITPAVDAVVARGLGLPPAVPFASADEMALALEDAVAPAPPSEIGRWVESLAAPALEERARLVEILERVESRPEVPPAIPPAASGVRDLASATSMSRDDVAAPPAASGLVTRRERAFAPVFETRRGLGPTEHAAERNAASHPSAADWSLPRKPRATWIAAIAALALVAVVGSRYLGSGGGSRASSAVTDAASATVNDIEPEHARIPPPRPQPSAGPQGEPVIPADAPGRSVTPRAEARALTPAAPRAVKPRRAAPATRDDVL